MERTAAGEDPLDEEHPPNTASASSNTATPRPMLTTVRTRISLEPLGLAVVLLALDGFIKLPTDKDYRPGSRRDHVEAGHVRTVLVQSRHRRRGHGSGLRTRVPLAVEQ